MKIRPVIRAIVFGMLASMVAMVLLVLRPIPGNVNDAEYSAELVLGNAKQLSFAFALYAADNDGRLPLAENWMDALKPYAKHNLIFFTNLGQDPPTYFAFFEELSGVKIDDVMDQHSVPVVFQSSSTEKNAHGGLDMAELQGEKGCAIAFLDGHAEFKPRSWRPETSIVMAFEQASGQEEAASED